MTTLIENPIAIMTVLMLVPAIAALAKAHTNWKIMQTIPPIIWVIILPIVLSNVHILPFKSPVYSEFSSIAIPLFIVLMLLDIDVRHIFKVASKSLIMLLLGAAGIVVGAVIASLIFKDVLPADAWKGFAPLVASWTGGTGNLVAVAGALETPQELTSVVVIVDVIIYAAWIFVLLFSKKWTAQFNKFTGSERSSEQTISTGDKSITKCKDVEFWNLLLLIGIGLGVVYFSRMLSTLMPLSPPIFTAKSWEVVIVTTIAILLSFTKLRKISGANSLSLAMLYIYLGTIGAQSDLTGFRHYPWFIFAASVCIFVHGVFCIIGARILKLDLSIVATSSAANIGGPAAVTLIAAHHKKELIPIGIIMVMIGYVLGNYIGFFVGQVCYWLVN